MRVELTKLFGRRRTWIALLLLNLLPTVVAGLLAWTRLAPRPGTQLHRHRLELVRRRGLGRDRVR